MSFEVLFIWKLLLTVFDIYFTVLHIYDGGSNKRVVNRNFLSFQPISYSAL